MERVRVGWVVNYIRVRDVTGSRAQRYEQDRHTKAPFLRPAYNMIRFTENISGDGERVWKIVGGGGVEGRERKTGGRAGMRGFYAGLGTEGCKDSCVIVIEREASYLTSNWKLWMGGDRLSSASVCFEEGTNTCYQVITNVSSRQQLSCVLTRLSTVPFGQLVDRPNPLNVDRDS